MSSFDLNMRSKKSNPRRKESDIGGVLFPKIRRQLLTLFFASPGSRHYFREISRLVNASPGAIQRELRALSGAGILATEKDGPRRYYWADTECMIHSELKNIVVKTFGVAGTIESAIDNLKDKISLAFLYGSIANGTDTAKSDIDLMIIGDISFRALTRVLAGAEATLARPINPTVYSRSEFVSKARSKNHFIRTIMTAEKLFIIGNQNDFAGLVQ